MRNCNHLPSGVELSGRYEEELDRFSRASFRGDDHELDTAEGDRRTRHVMLAVEVVTAKVASQASMGMSAQPHSHPRHCCK